MSETNDQTSPAPTAAERVLTADEIAAVATTRRMIADAEDTWRSMGCFDLDRPRGSEPVPMKCCRALLSITERLCAALSSDAPTSARGAFFAAIARELDRAYAKHGREPWGRHEFYAILREEVDELWDAVKGDAPFAELYPEIVQVAAMCFRYIETGDHYAGPHPIEPVAALAAAEQNVARLAAREGE